MEWNSNLSWMDKDAVFRIKPKKEKRWIGVYGSHVTDGHYPDKKSCERVVAKSDKFLFCAPEEFQFIEIEV